MTTIRRLDAERPADPPPTRSEETSDPSDLLARFAERAAPLGVDVARVPGPAEAADRVAALTAELGAPTAIVAAELRDAAPRLLGALLGAGVGWSTPGDPAATRDAPFGVSLVRLAVAETASVLLAEPTLDDRAIGMLTTVQLVVCPTRGLVASLDEAAPVLRDLATRPGGAYATLVTGPSRTADIERVLTVGVQGPARLAVLFVDDLA